MEQAVKEHNKTYCRPNQQMLPTDEQKSLRSLDNINIFLY